MRYRLISIAFVLFFVATANAVTLKYDRMEFRHDGAQGTFTKNGIKFGRIVGLDYEVHYAVGKRVVRYVGSYAYSPALKAFPTVTSVKTKISADFKAKNVENRAKQFPFANTPNLTLKN